MTDWSKFQTDLKKFQDFYHYNDIPNNFKLKPFEEYVEKYQYLDVLIDDDFFPGKVYDFDEYDAVRKEIKEKKLTPNFQNKCHLGGGNGGEKPRGIYLSRNQKWIEWIESNIYWQNSYQTTCAHKLILSPNAKIFEVSLRTYDDVKKLMYATTNVPKGYIWFNMRKINELSGLLFDGLYISEDIIRNSKELDCSCDMLNWSCYDVETLVLWNYDCFSLEYQKEK